jgi:DME family drug/metabolite transporter
VACVVGTVTLVPFAALSGLSFDVEVGSVSGLAYMGIIATAIAYGLFFHGLRTTTSEVASILTLLEPLAATALAVWLLHESLTARMSVGGALMLVAIAALYLRRPDPVDVAQQAPATIVR